MTELDRLYAAMQAGGDADGLAFYRALADAELFVLLKGEASGDVMEPRIFDLAEGAVLLAFDSEERLAGFSEAPLPYAALPGRVIAGQMVGQGLSLGLIWGRGPFQRPSCRRARSAG
jgi:SseB protein N-terminal domain